MTDSAGHPIIADMYGVAPWDALDAAHYDGSAFYVSHSRRKEPSPEWIAEGLRRGRILLPVGEDTGKGSAGGAASGVAFAQFLNGELARIGWAKDRPIANAESDYPAQATPTVLDYYRAFHDTILWPTITYADGEVCRAVKANGWSVGSWFTCSGSFPGSHDLTGCDLRQRCASEDGLVPVPGYSVDTNIILNPAVLGAQQVTPGDDPLTPAQMDELKAYIDSSVQKHCGEVITGVGQLLSADDGSQARLVKMVDSMHHGNYGETHGYAGGDLGWFDRHLAKALTDALGASKPSGG